MSSPAPTSHARPWLAAAGAACCFAVAAPGATWAPVPLLLGATLLPRATTGSTLGDLARGAAIAGMWGVATYSWLPAAWTRFAGDGGVALLGVAVAAHAVPFALAHALSGRQPAAAPAAWAAGTAAVAVIHPLPLDLAASFAGAPVLLWPAALGGRPLLAAAAVGVGLLSTSRPRWAAAALVAWATVGAGWLLLGAEPDARSARVALVEPGFGAYDMRRASTAETRAARLLAAVDALPSDVDLVVSPEGAWPHDPGPAGSRRRAAFEEAWAGRPPTVLGAELHDAAQPTNSLLMVEEGQVSDRYDKLALVPVAERTLAGFGAQRFAPGAGPRTLRGAGLSIGALICYEDLLPLAVPVNVDLIVAAANDGWLDHGRSTDSHLAATRLAAVTSGVWVVRATTSGRSALIDERGRVRWSSAWRDGDAEPLPAVVHTARVPAARHSASGAQRGAWLGAIALLISLIAPRKTPAPREPASSS